MSDIAIKIENLSKLYRLGVFGTQTLRGDLQKLWWKITGKGDPTLKIGQGNQLSNKGDGYVWALRDINLEVKKGEVLGIIGKNGAGKSTLLKILSRITTPTTGVIKIKGRLASLLEVGTGFHPELTGRENIYLNGSILGMTRSEIDKQFDAIVEFAGVAKYIDTPVKRYSSGMFVRLGFAVAAHLNSEILVVDEVLAVGDAEFQKKAIGKMQEVSKGEGRTVLFVSHNMGSVRSLCTRAIMLEKGRIKANGDVGEVIDLYLSSNIDTSNFGNVPENYPRNDWIKNKVYIKKIDLLNSKDVKTTRIKLFEKIKFLFTVEAYEDIDRAQFTLWIGNHITDMITYSASNQENINEFTSIKKGVQTFLLEVEQKLLPGKYFINLTIFRPDGFPYDGIRKFGEFTVENVSDSKIRYPWEKSFGLVYQSCNFKIIKND